MSNGAVGAGSVLSGRYRLVARLGGGGTATVWRALDLLLDREVAVKDVSLPLGLDDSEREALRRRTIQEAQVAARLRHPAIVTIYDVVEQDGRPWIVMELVPGRSLAEVIREDGPLPAVRVAATGLRVLDAMVTADAAGVQHRDIKPANIMVTPEGRVVLTDFGIARHVGDPTLTATGLIVGSPDYLSPERARGRRATGLAADLWSLGATMYHAVEGRRPFERPGPLPTLAAVVMDEPEPPRLAGPLVPVLDGLLIKDPAHRLDADRTRDMLERILRPGRAEAYVPAPRPSAEDGPQETVEVTPAPAAAPPPAEKPRRRALIAAVVAVLAAVAVLVPLLARGRGNDTAAPPAPSTPSASTSAPPAASAAPGTSAGPTTTSPAPATTTRVEATTAPPPAPATGADLRPPSGFTRYTDPQDGFLVIVPSGWRPVRHGSEVDFEDPSSSSFLRIDTSGTPLADPYQNWVDYEKSFRQGRAGYRLLGIRHVRDYRPDEGWTTADWEFLLGSTHVLNRNIRVSSARAHAIYWSTPDSRWRTAASTRIFDLAAAGFVPAPPSGR